MDFSSTAKLSRNFSGAREKMIGIVSLKQSLSGPPLTSKPRLLKLEYLAIASLRSFEQWDCHPQARAISDFPITIRRISDGPLSPSTNLKPGNDKCLRGLRVVEMDRVIAGPVAGKTLAAHDADRIRARQKAVRLDIDVPEDRERLDKLLEDADVFLQSYRPGSLASKGLFPETITSKSKKGIVCANLSAYGPTGPWSTRGGFDSLVQTCSCMNVSEAEHFGAGEIARPLPFQALDHASFWFFLAAVIATALYRQATEGGGSYVVDVSLAGTMKFLRSLGQHEGSSDFDAPQIERKDNVPGEMLEERQSDFGRITAVKHSAVIDGVDVAWDVMPRPLGSDRAEWLR